MNFRFDSDVFKEALGIPFSYLLKSVDERIFYLYFLSSLGLALFVYLDAKRQEGFLRYVFNPKVWLSKSAIIDYWFIFFNSFFKVIVLSSILLFGHYFSFHMVDRLNSWFGYSDLTGSIWLISFLFVLTLTVVEDFFSFLIHWLFHYVPFLWQFHKVHHSASVLNPITQYRIHPVELLMNNLSYLLGFGLVHGLFSWLFFNQASQVTTYSINIFTLLFFFWGANLRHSHVRLKYFPWLEKILISPFQHQIHHSNHPSHFNKNMGSKLAVWDWLFGTLIRSKEVKSVHFGLGEETQDFDTFWKTLYMPFKKLFFGDK